MVILDKLPHAAPVKNGEQLGTGSALLIGIAQMLALIPGVSRSGSTIIVGRLRGLNAHEAAEYSFLASVPIMIAVVLKSIIDDRHYMMAHLGTLALSNLFAFISGLLAIGFLLRYLSTHSLAVFGWYRIGVSLLLATILLVQYKK
jgi:undecaprenyl-diphosphatase